jgi:hypothetical protein
MMYAQAFNILPGLEKPILIPGMFLNLILEQIENKASKYNPPPVQPRAPSPRRLRRIGHRRRSIFCGFFYKLAGNGGAFAFRN